MFPVNHLICQSIIHYTSLSLSHCFLCLLVLTFLLYFYLSHFLSLVPILISYSLTHWPLIHSNWKYPRYMPNTKKKKKHIQVCYRVWVRVQGHREINSYFILHLMKKVQFNNVIQWKKRRKRKINFYLLVKVTTFHRFSGNSSVEVSTSPGSTNEFFIFKLCKPFCLILKVYLPLI